MTVRKWMAALAAVFTTLASPVVSQALIETYGAEIGGTDRRNSSGAGLTDPAAILTQDRANVHRFGQRQSGDTVDRIFGNREMRARMPSLLARGHISPAAEAALRSGGPAQIEVTIWGQGGVPSHLTVDLAGPSSAAARDPILSPSELGQAARSIQSALNARGFDAGPVDGQPGQRTRLAIAAFQNSIGTSRTGELTQSEFAMLTGGVADAGPSFDCRRAGTPTEIAICSDPTLAALDRALAQAWKSGGRPANQAAWLRSRDACGADVPCLTNSMRTRVFALGGQPEPTLPAGQASLPIQMTGNSFDGLAPGSAAAAEAMIPTGPRAHFDQGRLVDAPEGFARRLAMLEIKRDPSVLDDPNVLDAIRRLQNAETDPADRAFNALNVIEKEDSRAALRATLLQEADSARPVTPEDPLQVTLYSHARPHDFVQGTGLELIGGASQMVLTASPYPVGSIAVTLPSEIAAALPISRSEAAALIDRVAEERVTGHQPRTVIWGQITRIGRDESVETFATPTTQRGIPSTFEALRAELHFVALDSTRRSILPLDPGAEAVHRWPLGGGDTQNSGGQSALLLAQSLGLPTVGDALDISLPMRRDNDAGWGQFTALAWLGQNPDAPREGNAFIGVATGLMSQDDHRSFFGRQRHGQSDVIRMVADARHVSDPFPDEFARRDAKRVFFERYYDPILARAPIWPVQVRHSVVLTLGGYDFETEQFPLQVTHSGLPDGTFRVVDLPGDGRVEGLASAGRFGNLPEKIRVPPDQARLLRQLAQEGQVRLVWWADFDYSVDTTAVEQAFGNRRNTATRTGQGTLRRVGIFAGPTLDWEVLSFPVEDMLIPTPEAPAEPTMPTASEFAQEIAEAETSDQIAVAGHVARLLGEDGFDEIAKLMPAVQQANEFDAPAAAQTAMAQLRAGAEKPLIIRSRVALDTYDLEKGTFAFRDEGMNVGVTQGGLRVTLSLVGPNAFAPLEMDQATARFIAEQRSRNVMLLAELTPETAEPTHGRTHQISLLARPERIVFYIQDENNLPKALAERRFGEANAAADARMARRYEATEFDGLDEIRLGVTPHITDLIALRGGYEPPDDAVPNMVAAAWAERDADLPGPALFDAGQARPDAVWITRHRPMIRSWFAAKSAALAQDFTARIMANPDRSCGVLSEAYGRIGNEVMTAVPFLQDDQNNLARLFSEKEGPFKIPRRYAMTHTRPHPTEDRCTSTVVILVLEDALHEGRQSQDRNATQVEFTLSSADPIEAQRGAQGLVVRGKATSTRIVANDGSVGPVLTPTPEKEPVATSEMSAPGPADQIAAAQAVISPAQPAPQSQGSADWPEITLDDVRPAKNDLLGIAPGQSMREAAAKLSALDGIEAAFETATPPAATASTALRALGYQRVYLRRGGTEALSIASWGPDGEVVAIMRRMVLTQGAMPYDRILTALTEKYGEPDFVPTGTEIRGWGAPQETCYVMPFGLAALPRLVPADGNAKQFLQHEGTAHRMGMPNFPENIAEMYLGCGETLSYLEERRAARGHSGFSVVLMDFDRLEHARDALSPDGAAAVDFEIEF